MLLLTIICLLAEITLGSWNLKWFPSGRAEHYASERVEKANFEDAASVVSQGLKGNHSILFFQELRDANAATNLVRHLANTNLHVAVTTGFKVRENRMGWQQCAIITDLPVIESRWANWRRTASYTTQPPRGYAYALLDGGKEGLIGCFCIHLKSNYGAKTEELRASNAAKRELSAKELLEIASAAKSPEGRAITKFIIAGDFNTDPFAGKFEGEKTTLILEEGAFINCFKGLPLAQRGTHPGTRRYPDSTLDFFFHRGFKNYSKPTLSPAVPLSDHRMIWMEVE